MPFKSVTFADGGRSVSFELNGVTDVSGIGDVFARFMDTSALDVGVVVQTWGDSVCRNKQVSKYVGDRNEGCREVCLEHVGSGCLSCGGLFSGPVVSSSNDNGPNLSGSSSCVVGNRVEECLNESEIVNDEALGKDVDGVSEKTLRNRLARKSRKEKKKKRQSEGVDWRSRSSNNSLRQSLEKKWEVENALATEKAQRQLQVLRSSDIEQEKRKYRTRISAETERNMVSIENTHAKLRQTGNLPNEQGGGFAETVVSGAPGLESGSGTISPDSSASMAEFRACQKALLDAERENAEYKRKIKIASEKYGFPLEQVDFLDKEVWTDTQTNQDILDEIYPNGYGKDTSLFEDGKFRAIGV